MFPFWFISFTITHHSPCIVAIWEIESDREGVIGLFNVSQNDKEEQFVQFDNLTDGTYQNLSSNFDIRLCSEYESKTITVLNNGKIPVPSVTTIIHYSGCILRPKMFYSELFDFDYKEM